MAINDWSDLLQPRLRGRIGFTDSPRELVGVALKTLGMSYNSRPSDLARAGISVHALRERLQELHGQVSDHTTVSGERLNPVIGMWHTLTHTLHPFLYVSMTIMLRGSVSVRVQYISSCGSLYSVGFRPS